MKDNNGNSFLLFKLAFSQRPTWQLFFSRNLFSIKFIFFLVSFDFFFAYVLDDFLTLYQLRFVARSNCDIVLNQKCPNIYWEEGVNRYTRKLYNLTQLSAEVLHPKHTCEILMKSNNNYEFQTFGEGDGVEWGRERVPYEIVQLDNTISLSLLCLAYV